MRIDEVDSNLEYSGKLLQLASFLLRRAKDVGAKPEISKDMFINLANNYDVPITADQLVSMAAQPPLNAVFEPIQPMSNTIKFKGSDIQPEKLPSTDQAEKIVAKAAKSAMKRGLKK